MWCRASPVPVTAGNQTTSAASTYEDAQSNRDITLLASAARTASINSSDITNVNHRGVTVVIEATAATLTPSVVFTIQGKDAVSGVYYTLLASAAVPHLHDGAAGVPWGYRRGRYRCQRPTTAGVADLGGRRGR